MPDNFFKNIKNAVGTQIKKYGFKLNDDRGNQINLDPNQQEPSGIYRTYLPSTNVKHVMTKITSESTNVAYPNGFTPEEFYYVNATESNEETGFAKEKGDLKRNVSINNNSAVGKISKTNIAWSPANASPIDLSGQNHPYKEGEVGSNIISFPNTIPAGIFGPSGNANSFGNSKMTSGFTNPFMYITKPNNKKGVPGNPTTGLPDEFGTYPNNLAPNFNKNKSYLVQTNPNLLLTGNNASIYGAEEVFNLFNNDEQYAFAHNLDRKIPINLDKNHFSVIDNAYLASFVTKDDNEDPTMFGYDIIIKFNTSPLFNGSIIEFINQFGDAEEIESRRDVWITFCKQFFKFFKVDQSQQINRYNSNIYNKNWNRPASQTADSREISQQTGQYTEARDGKDFGTGDFGKKNFNGEKLPDVTITSGSSKTRRQAKIETAKTYYLKKISGLENLVEKDITSISESVKSMVDYGKDVIKLSLYEDVSVNTGYLASLYKALCWSRKKGKQIIPENLLRFDVKIVITEIRDYNKVIKDFREGTNLNVFPDMLTKYTYTLYDCQFLFNEMSHGSEIDMSSPKLTDDFDISFNYKYSNLSFDKFFVSGTTQSRASIFSIDNSNDDVLKVKSTNADGIATIDGITATSSITAIKKALTLKQYAKHTASRNVLEEKPSDIISQVKSNTDNRLSSLDDKWNIFTNTESNILDKAKNNASGKKILKDLVNKLERAGANEVNRQITTQARLLNRTIDNIRNSIGIGRMSEPTNVYSGWKISTGQDFGLLKNDLKNSFRDFVGQSVRGFFSTE